MGSLFADADDVARWEDEGRADILRYVAVLSDDPGSADLWIDSRNGDELNRCPFVRKIPN
jgi:hypothetical protein